MGKFVIFKNGVIRKIVFLFALIALGSCMTSMKERQGDRKQIIVFIHGIKGATLVDEKDSLVWLTGAQGLGLETPNLSLPKRWEGEIQEKDQIKAREVLSEVKVIPFLLEEKIYSPWLTAGKRMFGDNFHPFAYDWRRDNLENLSHFEKFIEKIRKENGEADVTVVAHSMGGLITLALINKKPNLLRKVIFVGVPFYGGIGFLEDLHLGTTNGLNKKILSKEVLFTMPSVYTLFPLETKEKVVAEDEKGNPIEINFYSADDWKKHGFSVFADKSNLSLESDFEFLQQALKRAKQFKEQIKAENIEYPPILVISGKAHPTFSKIQKNGKQSVGGWDFVSLAKEPGDGRVLEKNSFPPKGISYKTFYSDWTHSQLLNDPKVIKRVQEFIEKD